MSAVAREPGRSWDTVNAIGVAATEQLLLTAGPSRLDGVRVIGVDEHKWAHVFGRDSADSDGFVTVITDLTAVVAGRGSARLLDLVPGRSAAAMVSWLDARRRPPAGRSGPTATASSARVTDVPVVGHPLQLRVLLPRYRCRHDGYPAPRTRAGPVGQ